MFWDTTLELYWKSVVTGPASDTAGTQSAPSLQDADISKSQIGLCVETRACMTT